MKASRSKYFILITVSTFLFIACKKQIVKPIDQAPPKETPGNHSSAPNDDDNLLMGNLSDAQANILIADNYLMDKGYYSLSYNLSEGKANWVSWHLSSDDIGSAARQDDFRSDNTLPSNWYWVKSTSYSGSGFDRGHYCPSADRTNTTAANSATFVMTNMMPQAPNNNQNTWNNLEGETRRIVNAGNEAFIIAGSYGKGGTGSKGGLTLTIDNDKVTVPSNVWKVIVVLPKGNDDLSRVNANTRVIAVNLPNTNDILSDWKRYRTTVRAIEAATGYNLLSNLSLTVQDAIETKVDTQ